MSRGNELEYPSSFSSGLHFRKKIDLGCMAVGLLIMAIFPIWVIAMYVSTSEIRLNEIPGLIFFFFTVAILVFPAYVFCASIFRERLKIDNKAVIYRSALNRIVLSWDEIEGFAYTKSTIYLVYKSTKLANRHKLVSWFIKPQPLIPLSHFTREWPPRSEQMGPLMSTIYRYAPHLFDREEAMAGNLTGVQQNAE